MLVLPKYALLDILRLLIMLAIVGNYLVEVTS
jgi:hypothetical protein